MLVLLNQQQVSANTIATPDVQQHKQDKQINIFYLSLKLK